MICGSNLILVVMADIWDVQSHMDNLQDSIGGQIWEQILWTGAKVAWCVLLQMWEKPHDLLSLPYQYVVLSVGSAWMLWSSPSPAKGINMPLHLWTILLNGPRCLPWKTKQHQLLQNSLLKRSFALIEHQQNCCWIEELTFIQSAVSSVHSHGNAQIQYNCLPSANGWPRRMVQLYTDRDAVKDGEQRWMRLKPTATLHIVHLLH